MCNIIYCVIVKVIPRMSLENFIKTYRTFVKKQRKILKICPPSPQKSKTRQPQAKSNTSHKVFQSEYHQSVIKIICAKFHKKQKGSQEIEKNTTKQTKKTCKMASRRGGLAGENFLSAARNIFSNLYEKEFTLSTTKMSPK